MKYPKAFTDKKYPDFIRRSIVLKAYPKPKKVFPNIGLKNCEVDLKSLKLKMSDYDCCVEYLENITDQLENIQTAIIKSYMKKNSAHFYDNKSVKSSHKEVVDIIDNINEYIENDGIEEWIVKSKNKYDIIILSYIKQDMKRDYKILKKYLHSFEELLKFINDTCKELKIKHRVDTTIDYNKEIGCPFNNKNIKVCFSSDGEQGYWDTATMSQGRGIKSCMSWSSDHSTQLVGTIVDPYAGIIYLSTNEKTKFGSKMLARAVVRFVLDNDKDKPTILLETVYPKSLSASKRNGAANIFKAFISNKLNNKIPIKYYDTEGDDYYYDDYIGDQYTIPLSEPVEAIIDMAGDDDYYDNSSNVLSCRDSGISYDENKKFYDPDNVKI